MPTTEISASALLADDRVISLKECAQNAGVSLATLRREIAQGRGPRLTRLSPGRVGVRISHHRDWLDSGALELPEV